MTLEELETLRNSYANGYAEHIYEYYNDIPRHADDEGIIFGNDGYAEHERVKDGVRNVLVALKGKGIKVTGFGTTKCGHTWLIQTSSRDEKLLQGIVQKAWQDACDMHAAPIMDKDEQREHDEAIRQREARELTKQADELLDEVGFFDVPNYNPKTVGGVCKQPDWIKEYKFKRKPKDY